MTAASRICLALVACLWIACGPSLVERAADLEGKGDLEGAVDTYVRALEKNPGDSDARSALRRAGGRLLRERLDRALERYDDAGPLLAYPAYRAAMDLRETLERHRADPPVDAEHRTNWNRARDAAAADGVARGARHFDAGEFAAAERAFSEALEARPDHAAARRQWTESAYRVGASLLAERKWRQAYDRLVAVRDHRDADALLQTAVDSGRVDVAVVTYPGKRVANRLRSQLLAKLLDKRDPFRRYLAPAVEQLSATDADFTVHVHVLEADTSIATRVRKRDAWVVTDAPRVPAAYGKKDSARVNKTSYDQVRETITAKVVVGLEVTRGRDAALHATETLTGTDAYDRRYRVYDGSIDRLYTDEPDLSRPKKGKAKKRDFDVPRLRDPERMYRDAVDGLIPRIVDRIERLGQESG